jgi:NAD(P)-dependent dehydrogenase (short-subunit alcohol dehydrogenase family)
MRKNKLPGGKIVATASAAAIVPHETYVQSSLRPAGYLPASRYPEYDGAKAAVVNFVRATARILKDVSCTPSAIFINMLIDPRKKTSPSTPSAQVRRDAPC